MTEAIPPGEGPVTESIGGDGRSRTGGGKMQEHDIRNRHSSGESCGRLRS